MDTIHANRRDEFSRHYGDTALDLEPTNVQELIAHTGEWLEVLLMDGEIVDAVMRLIYERVARPIPEEWTDWTWRRLWDELSLSDSLDLPRSQRLFSLNGFAFWGLRPEGLGTEEDNACSIEDIESYVSEARAFLDAIPVQWEVSTGLIRNTVQAAEARVRIDAGKSVTTEQLASLARISLKSMKNLLAPKGGLAELRLVDGEVPGPDALRWLQGRPNFKSSVWMHPDGEAEPADAVAEAADVGEVVFVPVARDGSWFDPATCRNARGYTVGPKGAEVPVNDYREALELLSRMATPHWRRPNAAGNWGIVSGVSWQRKVVGELGVRSREKA